MSGREGASEERRGEGGGAVARTERKHTEASLYLIADFFHRFLFCLQKKKKGKKKVLPVLTFKTPAVLRSHYQRPVN